MTTRFLPLLAFLFLTATAVQAQERVTLNAYYPSPAGIYQTLTTGQLTVDDNTDTNIDGITCGGTNLGAISFAAAPTCANYALSGSGGDLRLNRSAGGIMHFALANTDQMVLTAAGRLGIGTTNPATSLQVSTGVKVGNNAADFTLGTQALGGGQALAFSSNGTNRVLFHANGNVAIGNPGAAPGSALEIYGPANFSGFGNLSCAGVNAAMSIDRSLDCTSYAVGGNNNNLYLNAPTGGSIVFRLGNVDLLSLGTSGITLSAALPSLVVNGNVSADAYYHNSDARLKNNITPLPDPLDRVLRLNGVNYVFNSSPDELRMGLIAQQVEPVAPEVVRTGADGMKAVDYSALVALLIEGMKEQQKEITALKARLDALERP